MTLDTTKIRAESELYLFGDCFEPCRTRTAITDHWVRIARQLCTELDVATERANDRENLRERLDVATSDCLRLMSDIQVERRYLHEMARDNRELAEKLRAKERDVTALGDALDATAKERDAADRDVERLARDGRDREEENATLYARLTKAFADLSNTLWMAHIPPIEGGRIRDALYELYVAVHNFR